jgi:hypothetical protein
VSTTGFTSEIARQKRRVIEREPQLSRVDPGSVEDRASYLRASEGRAREVTASEVESVKVIAVERTIRKIAEAKVALGTQAGPSCKFGECIGGRVRNRRETGL